MNKKVLIILALILVAALIVGIVACGKDDEPTPPNDNVGGIGGGTVGGDDDENDDGYEGGNGDGYEGGNDGGNDDGNGNGEGSPDQGEDGGNTEPEIEYVVWDGSIGDGFGGGSGSESDPYLIADGSQLAYLARQLAMGNESYSADGVCYKLVANIDLNNKPWSPIGSKYNISGTEEPACGFRGNFFGDGKIIKGLNITEVKSYYSGFGLFGFINGATVTDFAIEGAYLSGEFPKTSPVGIAIGVANNSSITGISVKGEVTAMNGNAGGFIGHAALGTEISNCSSDVKITAPYVGGFAAMMTDSSAANCEVVGELLMTEESVGREVDVYGGGFVGYFHGSDVRFSTTDITVKGRTEYQFDWLGGFIGEGNNSTAYRCVAKGDVITSSWSTGNGTVMHGAGFICNGSDNTTVERCSSHGKVYNISNKHASLYGFASHTNSIDCYSTSNVEGEASSYGFAYMGTSTRCIAFGEVSGAKAYSFGKGTFVSCIAFGDAKARDNYYDSGVFKREIGYPDPVNCYRCEDLVVTEGGSAISASELGGTAMFREEMVKASFYSFDEGFAEAWDFSEMDIEAGVYPKLKD